MSNKLLSVAWEEFSSNISDLFQYVRKSEDLTDVTLVCDDGELNAHKLMLYGGSEFFKGVLRKVPHQHPVIYIRGVKIIHLESILDFIYHGEVNIAEDDLNTLLDVAQDLKIKGLCERKEGFDDSKNDTDKKQGGEKSSFKILATNENVVELEECDELTIGPQDIEDFKINSETISVSDSSLKKDNSLSKNHVKVQNEENEYKLKHFTSEVENSEEKALKLMVKLNEPGELIKWQCSLCAKTNSDKSKIRKHVKSHMTSDFIVKEEKANPDSFYSVSFKDGEQIMFPKHELFQAKVLSLMYKTEDLNLKVMWCCKQCNRSSNDKSRIRKHVEGHIDSLAFQCLLCEEKITSSVKMNLHISRRHSISM